jgi:ABC-type amino acid transport substrate-binding protein
MAALTRLTDGLLGSIVALVTAPLGVGPALGGWLAGRNTETPGGGAIAGAIAGIVGAAPWMWLVYLASAGKIEPIGYHEGLLHVGVNTAAPETVVLWQELALAGLVGAVIVGAAAVGGFLSGLDIDVVVELREELDGIH